jgi:hypothetical protein
MTIQSSQPRIVICLSSGSLLKGIAGAPDFRAWLETCLCFAEFISVDLGGHYYITVPDILEAPGNAHKKHDARVKEIARSFRLRSCAQSSHADLRHSDMPRPPFARKTTLVIDGARIGMFDFPYSLEIRHNSLKLHW